MSAFRDSVAHDLAGAEGHHPPRCDGDFDARLGVAADPLALVAKDEGSKAGHLHILSDPERMAQLPDTTGMRNTVLIQRGHHYHYQRAVTVNPNNSDARAALQRLG